MFQMRDMMFSVGLLGAAVMLPIDLAKADQLGHASWYSLPGNKTANGEQMNPNELTAAHRSLPFGTRVLVENLSNGRSVFVRINDRGPFIGGRIIDLSKAAAGSIGMIESGVAKVRVTPTNNSALAALGESEAKSKSEAGEPLTSVDQAADEVEITAADGDAKVETAAPPLAAKSGSAKPPTRSKPKATASKASKSKHTKSVTSHGKAVAAKSSANISVKTADKKTVTTIAKSSVRSAAKSVRTAAEGPLPCSRPFRRQA